MTDAELLAAQHRVIVNMGGCTCKLEWKHAKAQPSCAHCQIVQEFSLHKLSAKVCDHDVALGHDCLKCPRGVAQV